MASEHTTSRPISVISKKDAGILSPNHRPTLDDVLNGRAAPPYTLAAYTAFLSQQHCLETLEFVTEAKKYATKYDEYSANFHGMPMTTESAEGHELQQDWVRILDIYVKPGAPREINLPAEERDDLVEEATEPKPPKPEALDPAVRRMRDLMSDSIFIPFCNSVKTVSHAATYNALSDFARPNLGDASTMTYDDRGSAHRRQQSSRRRSPPPTSTGFSRSPPQTTNRSSALTSGLTTTTGPRLSQHLSHTSVASEGATTDDSGGGGSPFSGDLDAIVSPPTTPPISDVPQMQATSHTSSSHLQAQRPPRSESGGGWKRMGMKIFGSKKKGSFREDT
ncbi:hypothetical protein LTS08_002101 [Lithohypha guttulata]|uniref:RGS domain-containing protein n=1 Tax=Lithohypha guttulata TaxID=1690604 RepID=A0AAN7TDB3_9EURO|nr:hypothetical protein LTR05_001168 [Lithohypha guttulata]KAK5104214.1 hypothetical protein LTS08_002101 [Lithohypha guttulata]